MEIYVTGKYNGSSTKIQIPIVPDVIAVSREGRFSEFDIIDLGTVIQANGRNPTELSWEGIFPNEGLSEASYVQEWKDPSYLDNVFRTWTKNGTSLTVYITDTKINLDVLISSYSSEIKYAGDYYYSIAFREREDITVSTTRNSSSSSATKVTVKKGDTLKSLAKKYLGKRSKYKKIYKANKTLIDARNKKERKKHPNKTISKYTIYTGQVLTIPSSSSTTVKNAKVKALKKALKADGYGSMVVNQTLDSATKTAMKKVNLRSGQSGETVGFVQDQLSVTKTKKYNKATQTAVKKYQRKKNLTVSGAVKYETLLAMVS